MSSEVVFAFLIIIISSNLIEPSYSQTTSEVILEAGVLGQIQGKISTTIGKSPRPYAQFFGIPYAKQTRFRPSELLQESLNNTGSPFNATQFGPECPQPQTTGSENCLFLNIFSPQIDQNTAVKYPILVFVHGAGFVSGNANMYDGARLLNKDIVLITFNYRLGVFGSYNLETPTAPGNAALYDVLSVLNWVKIFAQYFGGDPSQVTLAGQSSGAATVSHMVMSPLSKGLFHRAIASSGSAIDIWATSANPLSASLQVAVYAGCLNPENTSPNKTQVMTCMLNKTLSELILAQNTFQFLDMKSGSIGFGAITPSVQRFTFPEIETIVPQHPKAVLESENQNNVSLMMGTTRDDGGFALRLVREGYILANNLANDTTFMKDRLVPTIFNAIGISDPANTIANTFKDIYVEKEAGQSGNFSHMVPSLIDMLGVLFFKSASYQSVQQHSKITKDTYFYSFDYEGQYTRHPDNAGFPGGVAHADDLQYLFQLPGVLNEEEQELSDIMVDYWTNFVHTGNPSKYPSESANTVPTWPEFGTLTNEYLLISNAEIKQSSNYPASWVIANKEEIRVCPNRSDSNMFNPVLIIFQLLLIFTYAPTIKY